MIKAIVKAGARGSRLAQAQTHLVLAALKKAWPGLLIEEELFETAGDRSLGALKPPPGGKGLFTSVLEEALLAGRIDMAVHSLKDLPTASRPGLTLGAILQRATARDALVASEPWTLDSMPEKSSIGTSSQRRAAQLRRYRRDVVVRPIRGNVDTRVHKMRSGVVDAVVLAEAGLKRLGMAEVISSVLPFSAMLPAPGQGALAVQCRAGDQDMLSLLQPVDCAEARAATTAERTFLQALGGGCAAPIAAYARSAPDACMVMDALVATPDGRTAIRVQGQGPEPGPLGRSLAEEALRKGAAEVLAYA